ncbi:hypothetical protein CSKR_203665 [Clonorchis sinensis]|uniref:Uncharacterized protein n=1 Tax=Clonorchis sinensis TaxID=79923 RepID=A0A8T1N099_CLOSI|nr:hypothetical protein CSKR_203665 [Clonorchis sinensis]
MAYQSFHDIIATIDRSPDQTSGIHPQPFTQGTLAKFTPSLGSRTMTLDSVKINLLDHKATYESVNSCPKLERCDRSDYDGSCRANPPKRLLQCDTMHFECVS